MHGALSEVLNLLVRCGSGASDLTFHPQRQHPSEHHPSGFPFMMGWQLAGSTETRLVQDIWTQPLQQHLPAIQLFFQCSWGAAYFKSIYKSFEQIITIFDVRCHLNPIYYRLINAPFSKL